jgi:hypothetical protein
MPSFFNIPLPYFEAEKNNNFPRIASSTGTILYLQIVL